MVKVISLSEAAYNRMKTIKQPNESFSDVVLRLAGNKQPLEHFFGKWPGSDAEAKKIKNLLASDRRRFKTREVRHVLP